MQINWFWPDKQIKLNSRHKRIEEKEYNCYCFLCTCKYNVMPCRIQWYFHCWKCMKLNSCTFYRNKCDFRCDGTRMDFWISCAFYQNEKNKLFYFRIPLGHLFSVEGKIKPKNIFVWEIVCNEKRERESRKTCAANSKVLSYINMQ